MAIQPGNIKLIVFDLDDTLFSEWEHALSGYAAVAKAMAHELHAPFDLVERMVHHYQTGNRMRSPAATCCPSIHTSSRWVVRNRTATLPLPDMWSRRTCAFGGRECSHRFEGEPVPSACSDSGPTSTIRMAKGYQRTCFK